jgi:hypothetical protein
VISGLGRSTTFDYSSDLVCEHCCERCCESIGAPSRNGSAPPIECPLVRVPGSPNLRPRGSPRWPEGNRRCRD